MYTISESFGGENTMALIEIKTKNCTKSIVVLQNGFQKT